MDFILIPSFLDFNLQPIAKKVKSYIKHTNNFLKKLHPLTKLPDNNHLCAMDVVGLYPNIPHDEGLSAVRKRVDEEDVEDDEEDEEMKKMYLLAPLMNWQN